MGVLPARTGRPYDFPVTILPITDSNQELPGDIELIASAVHQMTHDLHRVAGDLAALRAAWEKYEPIVAAFQRGGVLAARTAARKGRT